MGFSPAAHVAVLIRQDIEPSHVAIQKSPCWLVKPWQSMAARNFRIRILLVFPWKNWKTSFSVLNKSQMLETFNSTEVCCPFCPCCFPRPVLMPPIRSSPAVNVWRRWWAISMGDLTNQHGGYSGDINGRSPGS